MMRKLGIGLITIGCAVFFDGFWASAEDKSGGITELESVDELRDSFNADRGERRILLLLSPT